jgi:hypothetical protein
MQDALIVHDAVKDSSVFWPVFAGCLTTVGVFMAGLVPYLQYRDQRQKEKQAEKEAAVEKEQKEAPVFVLKTDFEAFRSEAKANNDFLREFVGKIGQDVMGSNMDIREATKEIRESNDKNSRELRATLGQFKTDVDISIRTLHDRVQNVELVVATFDGRVKSLEQKVG